MTVPKIAYDLETAAAVVSISPSSLDIAIRNNELEVKYGGPKKTKPLISPDELKRWFDALPNEKASA